MRPATRENLSQMRKEWDRIVDARMEAVPEQHKAQMQRMLLAHRAHRKDLLGE